MSNETEIEIKNAALKAIVDRCTPIDNQQVVSGIPRDLYKQVVVALGKPQPVSEVAPPPIELPFDFPAHYDAAVGKVFDKNKQFICDVDSINLRVFESEALESNGQIIVDALNAYAPLPTRLKDVIEGKLSFEDDGGASSWWALDGQSLNWALSNFNNKRVRISVEVIEEVGGE